MVMSSSPTSAQPPAAGHDQSYPCPAGYRAGVEPSTHLFNSYKFQRWFGVLWDTQGLVTSAGPQGPVPQLPE